MFVTFAVIFMTPQRVIRTMEYRLVQLFRICRMTGYVPNAVLEKKIFHH